MATALLAAGDTTDAADALNYIFTYEETSSGYVKQNSWLNGTQEWNGTQEDEVAFPIVLAYQLGKSDPATWSKVELLANYIVNNGPYTGEERWEENSGYSPSTMAAEVAGLVCAAHIATANGATTQAATYLAKADAIQTEIDPDTYTTTGSIASGSYYVRITPNGNPNNGDTVSISNGGGTWDERSIVDQGFLELSRLGVKPASSAEITNSLAAVDATIKTTVPGYGTYWGRYNHDGYGETASGGDYTGAGIGHPWPVLSGERGEYDVQTGDTSDAQSMLTSMANAANAGYQISEQIWPNTDADGFTQGQPDNSATPLMWTMAQYVRLAIDISAGKTVDTPDVVAQRYATGNPPDQVSTTFNENATTYYGQNVFVVGSIPALGSWNTSQSVALSSAGYPVWSAAVSLPANTTFQYKYIKKNPDGSITWESDPNRSYTTPASGSVTLNDSWR
jgi:glucoamylase